MDRHGPVLNTKQAAEYLATTPGMMRKLKCLGEGPRVYKQGRLNVYYPADLDAWLQSRLVSA